MNGIDYKMLHTHGLSIVSPTAGVAPNMSGAVEISTETKEYPVARKFLASGGKIFVHMYTQSELPACVVAPVGTASVFNEKTELHKSAFNVLENELIKEVKQIEAVFIMAITQQRAM